MFSSDRIVATKTDPLDRRLQRVLADSPVDRAWRRRGMLVLCRAHSDQVVFLRRNGTADKVPCEEKRVRAGAAAGCGNEGGGMLARVMALESEAIFRTIICFL